MAMQPNPNPTPFEASHGGSALRRFLRRPPPPSQGGVIETVAHKSTTSKCVWGRVCEGFHDIVRKITTHNPTPSWTDFLALVTVGANMNMKGKVQFPDLPASRGVPSNDSRSWIQG